MRKVAAFGVDYCTPATSVTATLITAYSTIAYTLGTSIVIPWPNYTVTPADCFIPVNFIFMNSLSLLPNGVATVDWVAKTINFISSTCYSSLVIQAEFNTQNGALGPINFIPMTCVNPCTSATIIPQALAAPS